MNIFVTDADPIVSAKALDDKRVIKMILESAQMLSTAMHIMCGGHASNAPYKKTHENHPCSVWVRQSYDNYTWLLNHFQALCTEYTDRYGKTHKSAQHFSMFWNYGSAARHCFPKAGLTPFANCTPYKEMDTIVAYRITMRGKWANDKRNPTWKNTLPPMWS